MNEDQNIKIEEKNNQLKITFRWLSCVSYFIVTFALIINIGMLYGVFNISLADNSRWILWIIYFPFLFFLYYSIANLINKTIIIVSEKYLKIRIYPLPWLGNKTFDVKQMTQFYVKKVTSSSHSAGKTSSTISYPLYVVLTNGNHQKVIDGLAIPNIEIAKMVEQKIEKYLDIENKNIEGEYKSKL